MNIQYGNFRMRLYSQLDSYPGWASFAAENNLETVKLATVRKSALSFDLCLKFSHITFYMREKKKPMRFF